MVDFKYLYKGLCGLARAHKAGAMAGHLGAAVVAGYFFGEDQPALEPGVYTAVEKNLDRIIAGEESVWFDPEKAGITVGQLFEPLPDEPPQGNQIDKIAQALAGNIDRLRQSGHNVIFAAIALRALHDHPEFATPAMVDGICRLIKAFDDAVPGRGYYGKRRGWLRGDQVQLAADGPPPPYSSADAMIDLVMDHLIRWGSGHRRGFGGLFHIINHAAGLVELSRYGHQQLARRGLAAHRHHVQLWRSLPDASDELGPLKRAQDDPRTAAYWMHYRRSAQWSAWLTHRIKTLYGFFQLLPLADPAKRDKAVEQLMYLMA